MLAILSVGGTGKSPMVEYLVMHLKNHLKWLLLAGGINEKQKVMPWPMHKQLRIDIGDEPMQFHRKFPDVPVAVGEERMVAIPQLLHDHPKQK